MVRFFTGVVLVFFHPVKLFKFFVEPVIAQLMFHPEQHKQRAGKADGKTGNVNKGDSFLFE
jgi:hypothetical protein